MCLLPSARYAGWLPIALPSPVRGHRHPRHRLRRRRLCVPPSSPRSARTARRDQLPGQQTLLTAEVAGDEGDPMTAERRAILEPLIEQLEATMAK
jgi:hypothetical protein